MANSVFIGYIGGGKFTWDGSALTVGGVILAPDGSASAPSYSFASATGTGLYTNPADANSIYIASNGSGKVRIVGNAFNFPSTETLSWTSGAVDASADVSLSRGAANDLALAAGDSWSIGGAKGAATTSTKLVKKVTGIADNSATNVLTVTVPNANHAATIKVTLLSSNGSTDAFESSRTALGAVVLARTSGADTVAATATLTLAQIATVSGGATHTLDYGVSAIAGLSSATQTFTITVTINDSGNLGSNQVVVVAELVNAEATGVTIA